MGEGFERKGIAICKAYFSWRCQKGAMDSKGVCLSASNITLIARPLFPLKIAAVISVVIPNLFECDESLTLVTLGESE